MMIGKIAVFLSLAAAAWVLLRAGKDDEKKNLLRLKLVCLLAVSIVLFTAKLFPLALMILLAAGGVAAIELWRDRAIKALGDLTPGAGSTVAPRGGMGVDEAASVLGVAIDAPDDEVNAAYKKLIGQLHPDRGGTDYLAAKINDARRVMLEMRGQKAMSNDEK